MDFAQRNNAPAPAAGAPAPKSASSSKKNNKKLGVVLKWASLVLLFSVVMLLIALVFSIATSKTRQESKYVDTKQYQAVFLNGGQVYFGKITSLNEKYIAMSNIYYLRVNQTVQPNANSSSSNDVSLVKLGCELHGPSDQMVINASQVVFWENLKSDGQVSKAIADFQKQNPNGQNCAAPAANSTPAANETTKKQ